MYLVLVPGILAPVQARVGADAHAMAGIESVEFFNHTIVVFRHIWLRCSNNRNVCVISIAVSNSADGRFTS